MFTCDVTKARSFARNFVSRELFFFFFFFFFFSYLMVTHLFSPYNDTQRVGEDHPSVYLTNYMYRV